MSRKGSCPLWGVLPELGCSIVFAGCSVDLLSWDVSEFGLSYGKGDT